MSFRSTCKPTINDNLTFKIESKIKLNRVTHTNHSV